MAARAGMANLISELREMIEAGTADYTLAGVVHWTDDQLQAELDRERDDFRIELERRSQLLNNTTIYHDYYYDARWVEEAESGTPVWQVENTNGSVIGTANYTRNYQAGHLRFTTNTSGSVYYLRGRKYDLYRTAANVWGKKAAHYHGRFDIETDNHSLKRSQLIQHARAMRQMYATMAGPRYVEVQRSDVW